MPTKTLLEVLREDLQLTGTKHGCELGECGACAVLSTASRCCRAWCWRSSARAATSTTVEGLVDGRPARPAAGDVRRPRRGAVRLLHAGHPHHRARRCSIASRIPSRERIREALSGNLCRCTGYLQIFEAVEAAAAAWPRELPVGSAGGAGSVRRDGMSIPVSHGGVVGRARRRVDGRAKVTGQTRFADDLLLPRMLHCKLLRSPRAARAHRRHRRRRGRAALAGVHLVLTGDDFPIAYGILPVSQDEHALCRDLVRFVGDPVAAVDRARRADRDRGARSASTSTTSRCTPSPIAEDSLAHARAAHPRLRRRGQRPQEGRRCSSATSTRRSPAPTTCSTTCSSSRATRTCRSSSTRRSR